MQSKSVGILNKFTVLDSTKSSVLKDGGRVFLYVNVYYNQQIYLQLNHFLTNII